MLCHRCHDPQGRRRRALPGSARPRHVAPMLAGYQPASAAFAAAVHTAFADSGKNSQYACRADRMRSWDHLLSSRTEAEFDCFAITLEHHQGCQRRDRFESASGPEILWLLGETWSTPTSKRWRHRVPRKRHGCSHGPSLPEPHPPSDIPDRVERDEAIVPVHVQSGTSLPTRHTSRACVGRALGRRPTPDIPHR